MTNTFLISEAQIRNYTDIEDILILPSSKMVLEKLKI
tara:strand:+ start:5391 stop:5501 length:111 start_codon:yes stop_codon:yes gene_type:complete